jgi:hypothetical protein
MEREKTPVADTFEKLLFCQGCIIEKFYVHLHIKIINNGKVV